MFFTVKKAPRLVTYIPMGGTRENPNLIIPGSHKMEKQELDYLIQGVLAKRGLLNLESEIRDNAEALIERKTKEWEASRDLHYRVAEQFKYPKLRWGGLKPPRKRMII